jgi:predicted dehydrogenase
MKKNLPLKVGVIGFGSIGKRHCENLMRLGITNITLYREKGKGNGKDLKEVYCFDEFLLGNFDFVVLSNPTAYHFTFLEKLIPLQINLFVEKPIAASNHEYKKLRALFKDYKAIGMTAYNLRFHPCVKKVKEILDNKTLGNTFSGRFFVGQYLPDWHPESDYKTSYSSSAELGGGVVLDLIHEIDLAQYLCGNAKKDFHSIVGKVSDLKIETEDLAEIHYRSTNNSIVSIHLDYLVKGYSRYFEMVCEKGRIYCDLFKNEIQLIADRNEIIDSYSFSGYNRNDMYLSMMEYFVKNIEENTIPVPSLKDGLTSLKLALMIKSTYHE